MMRVSGRDIPIVQRPRRDGDPSDVIAGSERIRSVLNWYPQINDLDEIVRDTLAWEMKLNERAKPFDISNKRPGRVP